MGRAEDRVVAGRLLARLPARPRRGRAHPRPARHPGRQPGPRPGSERPRRHAGLLVAAADASSASRSSAPAPATAWPAWSTCATAPRRCSPPAPRRWSARSAATACAPSSASAGAVPAGWSTSTCAADGVPSCSPVARRTSRTPASGSPVASCSCTPTPRASGPRCWPSGSTATPSRRCPTSSRPVTSTTSTSWRWTPRVRAPRWCGTSRGAVRSISWTCAPASPSRSPARRATSSPRRRSPATGARS